MQRIWPSAWGGQLQLCWLIYPLDTRFGLSHQTELNRMRLKARTWRRDESLAELAEDVENLVRLAFPEAAEVMVEVLAKDQFVDALRDEDMRLGFIRTSLPHWGMLLGQLYS